MPVNWQLLAQSCRQLRVVRGLQRPVPSQRHATQTFQGWGDCGIDGGPGSSSGVCGEKKQRKMLSEQGHGVLGAQGHQEGDTGPLTGGPSTHQLKPGWLGELALCDLATVHPVGCVSTRVLRHSTHTQRPPFL